MKHRPALTFVMAWLVLPPCGAFSQKPANLAAHPASRPEDAVQPRVTRVYPLEQGSAGSIARTINQALPEVMCVPEETRNAIVVSADETRIAVVEQLLKALDVPSTIQVFPLINAQPEALGNILRAIMPRMRVAADNRSGSLIITSDPGAMKIAERLIMQLEHKASGVANRKIRFLWLVSDMNLPETPPDAKDVIEQLQSLGVQHLGLAAQNVVQTVSNGTFSIMSSSAAFSQCVVKIEGTFRESKDDRSALDVSLNAGGVIPAASQQPPGPKSPAGAPVPPSPPSVMSQLASIHTTLFARPGHKEVLAITPIGSSYSVFIIEVLAEK